MLCKILLALITLYIAPSWVDDAPFKLGPQTPEEIAIARKALQGDYEGGDIIVRDHSHLRNAVRNESKLWEKKKGKAIVPYVIDKSLESKKDLILLAMKQYEANTCIKFVPKGKEHEDYVKLYKGKGCASEEGRQYGEQLLTLGDGCYYIGSVVHELGHAIGLYHEHQRSDRDDYLFIYGQNVTKGELKNFQTNKKTKEILFNAFDHNSIMIYGNYAFSKEPGVLMTMESKNGKRLEDPFGKPGLDTSDILRINLLYKCKK